MKKFHLHGIIAILLIWVPQCLAAQVSESFKNKELYLSGNLLTFNNFGLQYKSELKNGNFFRLGVTDLSSQVSKQNFGQPSPFLPSTVTDLAGTFDIGLEKRKQITNKLTAFYGVNFVVMTTYQRTKTEDPALTRDLRHLSVFSVNPGLGFNSGFIYTISGEFSIAAEISPRLLYHYSTTERISGVIKVNDTTQGGSFNIGNQSVRVSLIYHWIKD